MKIASSTLFFAFSFASAVVFAQVTWIGPASPAPSIDMSKADNCFVQQVKEADATSQPSILIGCGSDIVSNQPTPAFSQISNPAQYIAGLHATLKTKMGSPAHLVCQDFDSPAILLVLCRR